MSDGLAIQINDLDSYVAAPLHLDQLQNVPKVPVIRIYGSLRVPGPLPAYPILVHVHNCYPYLFIDCPRDPRGLDDKYTAQVASLLDLALAESFQRNNGELDSDDDDVVPDTTNPEESLLRFVASVALCRGCPVYGYSIGYQAFLKVLLLLPLYKTRLFKLLSLGSIDFAHLASGGPIRIYEAHLNYLMQFLADFNLQPCGWLDLRRCNFRSPLILHSSLPLAPLKEFLSKHIASNNILHAGNYPRMGRSLLEIDCHAGDILNRQLLEERLGHNDFSEFLRPLPKDQLYLSSLKTTLDDLKYQCTLRGVADYSDLLKELYSQVFSQLGKDGYNEWETKQQSLQQLAFVSRINKPSKFDDVEKYYESCILPTLAPESLPTVFELVAASLPMDAFGRVPLLNFRDDLVKWKSYEDLFDSQDAFMETSDSDNQTNAVTTQRAPFSAPATPPSSPLPMNSSPPAKSSPPDDIEDFHVSVAPEDDLRLFISTQRFPRESHLEPVQSSGDSLLSQTLNQLLSRPENIWEFAVPRTLLKKLFVSVLSESGVLDHDYIDPSYFKPTDAHPIPLTFANRIIHVPLQNEQAIPPVNFSAVKPLVFDHEEKAKLQLGLRRLQYSVCAPSKASVNEWLTSEDKRDSYKRNKFRSQIEPLITQTNDYKYSLRSRGVARNPSGFLNLSLMEMELHAHTFDDMRPDPTKNPVAFLIYLFDNANQMFGDGAPVMSLLFNLEGIDHWLLRQKLENIAAVVGVEIKMYNTERQMIDDFMRDIDRYDPDILSGYEVNAASWGYLCERYLALTEGTLIPRLSKVNSKGNGKFGDRWGYTHTSALKINGRHMFNVWRLLKGELHLTSYNLENICFHLLHQTLPKISNQTLSAWFRTGLANHLLMFCTYYKHRLDLVVDIIDTQELVLRNVELSRLLGIDFYSNYYRGLQFKVESLLMRIAKTENALLNSPSKSEVHNMRALEVVPLIMEPESNFYKSPLVVLDFQSLYPSIMIAYNYCYSTLIGRLEGYRQKKNNIGYVSHHSVPHGLIDVLAKNNGLNISPNGLMFVSTKVRKSILSRMLQEILNMRINVKSVASRFRDEKELGKLLNSKQLALKLIANVTYGYTSASFSGRMPNSDIADAIVATGRELMKKSIEMIEDSPYGAKVVYGDTDSLFVYFPGRSREFAFDKGKLLADTITKSFPDPVKLKFEKIYHPSVLLAKKRYVGHCYEFKNQTQPTFEAKGIETIRRDGIPAQLKMVGKSLRILFETKNLSLVKEYVVKQFFKILFNRVNVSDFCFAKGVRYGTYKNERYLPPGALIAKNNIQRDPRSEPQYRERVPYLVTRDSAKERIKDRCVAPEVYMASYNTENPMELDFEYYITRVLIPPLERIFNLMGVNVKEWYRDMPKTTKLIVLKTNDILKVGGFMRNRDCVRCGSTLEEHRRYICSECLANKLEVVHDLLQAGKEKELKARKYELLCMSCSTANFRKLGTQFVQDCVNQDCRTYYAKIKSAREYDQYVLDQHKIIQEIETCEW